MRRSFLAKDTGSIALTTAVQQQPDVLVKPLGHIIGFSLIMTSSLVGTLVTPKTLELALNELKILDAAHNVVFDIQGADVPYLDYLTDRLGTFTTPSTLSNSAQTNQFSLYFPVNLDAQPLTLQIFLEAYSNLAASGATGGATQVKVNVFYDTDVAVTTLRLTRFDASVVSGDNDISSRLAKQISAVGMVLRDTASVDTNVTNITFRSVGSAEIEQITPAILTSRDADEYTSGHKAGLFVLRVSPFVSTDSTFLNVNASGSATVRVYQFFV